MSTRLSEPPNLPPEVAEMVRRGFVTWRGEALSAAFRARFDSSRIPVVGVRHVRQWGVQVDDERELPGHERTTGADEELWELRLEATDGATYEVNAALLEPA